MNKQPEALRLIQHMDDEWQEDWDGKAIRAELRRLFELAHEQHSEIYGLRLQVRNLKALNQELLEALKALMYWDNGKSEWDEARAAIAKAQGEQA